MRQKKIMSLLLLLVMLHLTFAQVLHPSQGLLPLPPRPRRDVVPIGTFVCCMLNRVVTTMCFARNSSKEIAKTVVFAKLLSGVR